VKSGPWRFLMYLVLPHPAKMALLPDELQGQLDRINLAANVGMYSGSGATSSSRRRVGKPIARARGTSDPLKMLAGIVPCCIAARRSMVPPTWSQVMSRRGSIP